MSIKRINRGRGHSYEIDGKKAIGVTTALSKGLPKPALVGAAAKVVAQRALDMTGEEWAVLRNQPAINALYSLSGVYKKKWNEAAVRGTQVHTIAEQIIHGQAVEVPEELYGHVQSALHFMDDWKVSPLLVERTVGDYRYGYAGTFDLIAELPDGRRVLFDYKTSASGIWPETALQLAAYRWASTYVAEDGTELPVREIGIDECKAVHLRADGYDVYPLRTDLQVFTHFLHILATARAEDDMKSYVGQVEAYEPRAVAA